MAFQIRPFSFSDDLSLCTESEKAALLDADLQEDPLNKTIRNSLKRIEEQLRAGTYWGFTAVEDGTPVSLIFVDIDGDTAFVDNLYVVPDKRGKGLGEKLLRHTLDELQRHKVKTVELMVTNDNVAAVHLYEKMDFKVSRFRMTKEFDR